jgi:hypothetical protein
MLLSLLSSPNAQRWHHMAHARGIFLLSCCALFGDAGIVALQYRTSGRICTETYGSEECFIEQWLVGKKRGAPEERSFLANACK